MKEIVPRVFAVSSLSEISDFFSSNSFSSAYVLVDENTYEHCYPKISEHLPPHSIIQIKSGEENKSLQTCAAIWQKLTHANADRNSMLINLGGGVICDIGGFAAGCYKRGIKFINIPTTLLALVDASVGGKTGIDFVSYKNQIGLFNEPEAVFIDTIFLETLSQRELIAGVAEMVKHYLIADKIKFGRIQTGYATLLRKVRTINWQQWIEENIQIKSRFVSEDFKEAGLRKALNFGHTIGHAVESYFLNKPKEKLLHGEAVAIGMIAESFISMKKNLISEAELDSISKPIIIIFSLPLIPETDFGQIVELIKQDKKNTSQQNRFTLLKGIGNYSVDNIVEEPLIIESLRYYNGLLS